MTRRLLVINFAVDADHPVLGFATRWLSELRTHVDSLSVITNHVGSVPNNLDAKVICSGWREGQDVRNVLRFERTLMRELRYSSPNAVFTHMASAQGVLASIVLRPQKIRHVLWYAHPAASLALRASRFTADQVVTSVPESCPIDAQHFKALGQGIDLSLFSRTEREVENCVKFAHWGRCDPAKRIDHLAAVVDASNKRRNVQSKFLVIGSPSSDQARDWWNGVLDSDRNRDRPVIRWLSGVSQAEIESSIEGANVFLHASLTGFDKAPLEACALGLCVLSESGSIRERLGSPPSNRDLIDQIDWYLNQTPQVRASFRRNQYETVATRHSLPALVSKLIAELYPA